MENIFKNTYSKFHNSLFEKLLVKKRKQIANIIKQNIKFKQCKSLLDIGTTNENTLESSNLVLKSLKNIKTIKSISNQKVNQDNFSYILKKDITKNFTPKQISKFKSDIVLANAVIEHVGSAKQQEKMISNLILLSRKYIIVQTINKYFPIETHTKIPLLHFHTKLFRKILTYIGEHRLANEKNLNLCSEKDLRKIFQKFNSISFKILKIKTLGFNSNIIVICQKLKS